MYIIASHSLNCMYQLPLRLKDGAYVCNVLWYRSIYMYFGERETMHKS